MIKRLLKQLGFTDKEVVIYLEMLRQKKISPSKLARLVNIKRSTVYAVCEELEKRGLVKKDHGTTTATYLALPPQEINSLIENKQQKLNQQKHVAEEAVWHLEKIIKETEYPIPKINFIQQENIENYLYKQSSVWNKSLLEAEPIIWGFRDKDFAKNYKKWINWYWTKNAPKEVKLKLLTNQSEAETKIRTDSRREIKYWKNKNQFSGSLWVNGDYIVMVVTRQKPHYLVEIYDKILAENIRVIFKEIWKK